MTTSRANELTAVVNRSRFDDLPFGVDSIDDQDRWRRFRVQYHAAHAFRSRPDFPLQIDFELDSRCNMRCSFCLHGNTKVERAGLTFDQFADVIHEGQEHGLVSIKLNYINEPLLVRDLARYIRYARAHGVLNTYFATNGLLLTEKKAIELIEAGLSKIMISLDAVSASMFLAMRQSQEFDRIVRNIERFLEIRERLGVKHPLLRVNFVKTNTNIEEADAFVARWTGVADMIGLQDQVQVPNAETKKGPRDLSQFRCSFPYKQLIVDSTGQILPCCTFSGREMPLGRLGELTLKQAWDSLGMRHLQRQHATGTWRDNAVCAACLGA